MLGLLECEAVAGWEPLACAGDWDLGVGVDDEFGGPLAQADFCGSGVGSFGADATEDLLILVTPGGARAAAETRWVSSWGAGRREGYARICTDVASFDMRDNFVA